MPTTPPAPPTVHVLPTAPAMPVVPPPPAMAARFAVPTVLAVRAVAAAALTAIAALSFQRLLPLGSLAAAAGAGIACALIVGVLTRRAPLAVSLAATAVLWLPAACLAIGAAPLDVVRGVGSGWWRILTTVPPLGADPEVLAAVSALSAFAAFGAVEVALRTKAVLPLAAFGLPVLLLGLLSGGPGSDVPVTVAFAAATALLTVALTSPVSGYAAGAPAVVAIGVVALLAGTIGSGRTPFDPRRLVSPPPAAHPAVDPLQQVAAWVETPSVRLFKLTADATALTTAPNLRLTVLDRFDGTAWSSDAVYTATGSRIPDAKTATPTSAGATTAAATAATVHENVSVDQLSTLWLPAASRPTTISAPGSRLAVDPDGELLIPAGTRPGLTYAVTAHVVQYPEDQLRAATPLTDSTATALPGDVPQIITTTAQNATAGAGFPYQQAEKLADYLRKSAVYDPTAPAGDSYGHIAYFLSTSHRGGSDQFAVAFALMARSLGLPTRIAVGFAVPPTALAAAQNAGTGTADVDVTGADALVWPEVDFAGLGWVPFYPTPSGSMHGGMLQPASGESTARQTVDTQLAAAKLPTPQQVATPKPAAPAAAATARSHAGNALSPWLVAAAGTAAALLLYLGYVLGAPELRRARRRRSQDPAAAVLGAWWETVALLRTMGLGSVDARTSAQIAAFGVGRLDGDGPRAVTALARTADFAAFAPAATSLPDAPSNPMAAFLQEAAGPRRTCDAALVAEAWANYASVRAAFRAAVPVGARMRRRLLSVPRREV